MGELDNDLNVWGPYLLKSPQYMFYYTVAFSCVDQILNYAIKN